MIYWLERTATTSATRARPNVDSNGALLKNHKLFISSGHDEYWSASQRANVEAALAAGVNLAFFSGNEMFWKTRWGPSTEGSNTPYRTLITYKETHFNAPVDPDGSADLDWRLARPALQPARRRRQARKRADRPGLPGQRGYLRHHGALPVRQGAAVAQHGRREPESGQTLTLAPGTGTLGYEWDVDADNGFRPAGEFDLSSTTVSGLQTFNDYGSTTHRTTATATHHLTLYKAPSGALVFGAGTVQWSWGLATSTPGNRRPPSRQQPPDPNMEQATVNLFADMGVQPKSLITGLVPATKSTDTTPPTSTITSPAPARPRRTAAQVTITGTATDTGGGVVAGVEVSTDGGTTWHPATITDAG